MQIQWVGQSKIWNAPKPDYARYALPLVEEQVLSVAFDPEFAHLKRLTKTCAINCTSRLAQRVALSTTGLNPKWQPYNWSPGVIKAPASCQNNGVYFSDLTEHVWLLSEYAPELANIGVVEEKMIGIPYELDGAYIEGNLLFFAPIRQQWNQDFTKIVAYERADAPPGLFETAATAIKAVGLDNSCFCIEFRHFEEKWKVVEVHARLGEDVRLTEKLSDSNPLKAIENLCTLPAASAAIERDWIKA